MSERPIIKFRPALEPLEAKRPLSASASTLAASAVQSATPAPSAGDSVSALAVKPKVGYLVYRITNPNRHNNHLTGPFGHVLVQAIQPVPGQVYNVLSLSVRNGTAKTFDASSGFSVEFPGQSQPTPILTGDEQWKPGQEFIFYVLTKKYYPLQNQVTSGFQFFLGGAKSVAIPGPSGIFLRLKYDPSTINSALDKIVTQGPGTQGGIGIKYGLPDTAIYEFVSSATHRNDFGGLF